ncbi:MAG: hypothetical protein HY553_07370 [Elusimicrobia bacterium]|nr:hypothetical protein [Elusimicrobiota bacterium]
MTRPLSWVVWAVCAAVGGRGAAALAQEGPAALRVANLSGPAGLPGSLAAGGLNGFTALGQPGLLGLADRTGVGMSHATLFEGARSAGLSFIRPRGEDGAWAVSLHTLDSGQAETRGTDGKADGSRFSASEQLLRAGYGGRLRHDFTLGGTVTLARSALGAKSHSFAAAGLGAAYTGFPNLVVGAAADEFAYARIGKTTDRLSPGLRVHGAYALWKDALHAGASVRLSPQAEVNAGLEYALLPIFGLRVGRSGGASNVGFGLKVRSYALDYQIGVHELGSAHQISLSTSFGHSRGEERAARSEREYEQARRYAAVGDYEGASAAMSRAERLQALVAERRALRDALSHLAQARVRGLSEQSPLQNELRKGVGYYLAQRPELAQSVFLQVQARDPKNLMTQRLLALPGLKDLPREGPKGAAEAPSFTEIDPIKLKLFKTEEYFQKQQWDLALKECRDILAINPREVTAYVRLGSIFYALGMKAKAVQSWLYAESLDPANREVQGALRFMRQNRLERPGER